MHLMGAALISGASLVLGLTYIQEQKRRLYTLCSLLELLKAARGELATHMTPIPELTAALAQKTRGAAAALMFSLNARLDHLGEKDFSELWAESVKEKLDMLDTDERDAVSNLGRILGRYELEQQLMELDNCIEYLNRRISFSRSALPEKRRLGLGLACGAGALLVIVLL